MPGCGDDDDYHHQGARQVESRSDHRASRNPSLEQEQGQPAWWHGFAETRTALSKFRRGVAAKPYCESWNGASYMLAHRRSKSARACPPKLEERPGLPTEARRAKVGLAYWESEVRNS